MRISETAPIPGDEAIAAIVESVIEPKQSCRNVSAFPAGRNGEKRLLYSLRGIRYRISSMLIKDLPEDKLQATFMKSQLSAGRRNPRPK